MQEKTKRRRSERLIEKYAKIRDLRDDEIPDCEIKAEHEEEAFTSFAPIPLIRGVFDSDELLENFDIFQKNFPDLAPSLAPFVRSHIHGDSSTSSLFNQPNDGGGKTITDFQQWCEIEQKVKKVCPLMLSFVSQMVNIEEIPSKSMELPCTSAEAGGATTVDSLQKARILRLKTSEDEKNQRITSCAASASVLGVGVENGEIFLFDLFHQNRDPLSITELELRYGPQDKCGRLKKQIIQFHRQSVTIMCYAGHDDLFFSADVTGTISHWDALAGVLLRSFPSRLNSCADLALCWRTLNSTQNQPNSIAFISAYDDGAARLFYAGSASYRRIFAHGSSVKKVALLRDRLCATVALHERVIRVWDVADGAIMRAMDRLDGECIALEFLDERKLFAVTDAGSVYLFGIHAAVVLKRENFWEFSAAKKLTKEVQPIMLDFISRIDRNVLLFGVSRLTGERKVFSLRFDGEEKFEDMILEEFADLDRILSPLIALEPQPHNRRGARKVAKKTALLNKLRLVGISRSGDDYSFIVRM